MRRLRRVPALGMDAHVLALDSGITLRPVAAQDRGALRAHWSDAVVRRFLWDDEAPSDDVVEALVVASIASFTERGYGMWAIVAEARLIGMVSVATITNINNDNDFFDAAHAAGVEVGERPVEVLYSLDPEWHGRGVVTRAAAAVLTHTFALPDGPIEIWAGADADNTASVAVMRRLGMRYRLVVPMPLGPGPYWSVNADGSGG